MDLVCSNDIINNNFPEKWIAIFQGTYHRKGHSSRHTFISFNGGKSWKMFYTQIEHLVVLNHGGLVFGMATKPGRIMYSYNEGKDWRTKKLGENNVTDIQTLESPGNLAITTINYKTRTNTYYLFLFNFSPVFSILTLMLGHKCQINDFKTWEVYRYFRNCFQGHQISYLKKKRSVICVDNRTSVQPDIKTCPCYLEDFQCKPNYYYKDNFCVLDPAVTFIESKKTCRDGGKPLTQLNGFPQMNSDLCIPRQSTEDENSDFADYCLGFSN
ncbi:Sortilin [Thelohanellus kitauei]|uniref:Sortilin n=1 Tax=Thelohanellus kitauei TaxID=669202 RepID=A0A0C2IGE6_THEKT|nr:Sortilin [Thelohanellus kitauei]